jgi:hypothetical protein
MVVRVPLGICETRFVCLETKYNSDNNGLLRYNGKSAGCRHLWQLITRRFPLCESCRFVAGG